MSKKPPIPRTRRAMPRGNRRNPNDVVAINLRVHKNVRNSLDTLCRRNDLSRRMIIEILVSEAFMELQVDPEARIYPL